MAASKLNPCSAAQQKNCDILADIPQLLASVPRPTREKNTSQDVEMGFTSNLGAWEEVVASNGRRWSRYARRSTCCLHPDASSTVIKFINLRHFEQRRVQGGEKRKTVSRHFWGDVCQFTPEHFRVFAAETDITVLWRNGSHRTRWRHLCDLRLSRHGTAA